jgi:hypothetical protein
MIIPVLHWSSEDLQVLRSRFLELPEVTAFSREPKLAAKIASLGIHREIGGPNNELARFIYDMKTGAPVRPESLKSEIIKHLGLVGVRVFSEDTERLELRSQGFYDVIHPDLSQNADGSLSSLYIFPEIINQIAKAHGVELVLVKSWGMNSIFGGFDPSQTYYQTNFWELENNDALKFADLVRQRQLAFLGTHDLIAHIAGIDGSEWPQLQENAQKVFETLSSKFPSGKRPNIAALILPYTLGTVLDDLAQPPSYGSKSHLLVFQELLERIERDEISPDLPTLLAKFPPSFQNVIELSRSSKAAADPTEITRTVGHLVREIREASLMGFG